MCTTPPPDWCPCSLCQDAWEWAGRLFTAVEDSEHHGFALVALDTADARRLLDWATRHACTHLPGAVSR